MEDMMLSIVLYILEYENVNFDHLWEEHESNDCKLRDFLFDWWLCKLDELYTLHETG